MHNDFWNLFVGCDKKYQILQILIIRENNKLHGVNIQISIILRRRIEVQKKFGLQNFAKNYERRYIY